MYSMFHLACLIIINCIQSLNLVLRCHLIDKQRAGSCFVVFWFKVESAYHESFFGNFQNILCCNSNFAGFVMFEIFEFVILTIRFSRMSIIFHIYYVDLCFNISEEPML